MEDAKKEKDLRKRGIIILDSFDYWRESMYLRHELPSYSKDFLTHILTCLVYLSEHPSVELMDIFRDILISFSEGLEKKHRMRALVNQLEEILSNHFDLTGGLLRSKQ